MQAYRTEGNYRSAARLSAAELRAAMASHEILQATALAFDTQRQLRFDLGGVRAVMPFVQCADGAENGEAASEEAATEEDTASEVEEAAVEEAEPPQAVIPAASVHIVVTSLNHL